MEEISRALEMYQEAQQSLLRSESSLRAHYGAVWVLSRSIAALCVEALPFSVSNSHAVEVFYGIVSGLEQTRLSSTPQQSRL